MTTSSASYNSNSLSMSEH